MYLLVVAGGIASGKSTVAKRLEKLGAARIDLDDLSRKILEPGSEILPQVAAEFGNDLLDENGELNRALLAERVFVNEDSTKRLEAIEHPAIISAMKDRIGQLEAMTTKPRVCVIEIPLLNKAQDVVAMANEVLAVVCPLEIRRERAIERGMSGEDFDKRVANQPSDAYLIEHAHHVIDNSGSLAELIGKTDRWWDCFMRNKPFDMKNET